MTKIHASVLSWAECCCLLAVWRGAGRWPRPGAPARIPPPRSPSTTPRVTVREITLAPGAKRPARTRETDELVLFYAESHYQAVTDAGKTEPRDRAAGAVVWHKKGERAPTLVNPGTTPVRYYSIAIK